MRKDAERLYGRIRTLQTDQDTSYLKTFQKHLDKSVIDRKNDARYNKISNTERVGGLFKRHLATIAKEKGKPWHDVLTEAEKRWNSKYPSRLRPGGPPESFNQDNFDQLLRLLYKKDAVELHALYPIGQSFTEGELSEIFRYKPGDLVSVSLKSISKRMQGPVSALFVINYSRIAITFGVYSHAVLETLLGTKTQELDFGKSGGQAIRFLQGEEGGHAHLRGQAEERSGGESRLRGGDEMEAQDMKISFLHAATGRPHVDGRVIPNVGLADHGRFQPPWPTDADEHVLPSRRRRRHGGKRVQQILINCSH